MLTAAPSTRSTASLVEWPAWVGWWPRRSRVEGSCHQTRELGHDLLTCYSMQRYAALRPPSVRPWDGELP